MQAWVGTNSLEIALFLPADALYRGPPIFAELGTAELILGVINIGLTLTLIGALYRRGSRTWLGFGKNSLVTLAIYAAGLWLVYRAGIR